MEDMNTEARLCRPVRGLGDLPVGSLTHDLGKVVALHTANVPVSPDVWPGRGHGADAAGCNIGRDTLR